MFRLEWASKKALFSLPGWKIITYIIRHDVYLYTIVLFISHDYTMWLDETASEASTYNSVFIFNGTYIHTYVLDKCPRTATHYSIWCGRPKRNRKTQTIKYKSSSLFRIPPLQEVSKFWRGSTYTYYTYYTSFPMFITYYVLIFCLNQRKTKIQIVKWERQPLNSSLPIYYTRWVGW